LFLLFVRNNCRLRDIKFLVCDISLTVSGTQDSSLIIVVTVYFCVGKCEHNSPESCVISGFCRGADENCALLSYYAGSGDNFLLTFRDNLPVAGWDKILDHHTLCKVQKSALLQKVVSI
jgi:hypothetical protein